MAWVKVPKEHHPLFAAALPKDKRITTLTMFGGIAAMVNGNLFAGLFARSIIVRLAPKDRDEALALDGTTWFEPMEGRPSKDTLLLSESVMEDMADMKLWLQRAFDYSVTLPAKRKKA